MSRTKTIISIIIIGIICLSATFYIFSSEPVAEQSGATKKSAMLVETTAAESGDFNPIIKASGNVQPAHVVDLAPRISGEVVRLSNQFNPGSFVKKGQVLLQIDPTDFQQILNLRKSELEVAKAQYDIEKGLQEAARYEYEQAKSDDIAIENDGLLLREPQLKIAEANIKVAETRMAQAEINLQRTSIRAPFDAHVMSRNVDLGSQVNIGDLLGSLIGTDEYWVQLNIPQSKIQYIDLPQGNAPRPLNIKLTNTTWNAEQYRMGSVYQIVGSLTDQTRFAQMLISVPDPLSINDENKPTLIIGSFLEAEIPAKSLNDVIRLDKEYLRKDETTWVMKEGKLDVRKLDIVFQDDQYVYVRKGLSSNDPIITTSLSTVVAGAEVRTSQATD